MVLEPFVQAPVHHLSALHYPSLSACFKSYPQVHRAQFHDCTASNPQLGERARRDLRDSVNNDTNCVNLPVCVPMNDKLFETPASIGKEPCISDPQPGRI